MINIPLERRRKPSDPVFRNPLGPDNPRLCCNSDGETNFRHGLPSRFMQKARVPIDDFLNPLVLFEDEAWS